VSGFEHRLYSVMYLSGQYPMIATIGALSAIAVFWHGVSSDGRSWSFNGTASMIAAISGVSLTYRIWSVKGSVVRIYFNAGSSDIMNGVLRF
jgi:hypothetical protein